MCNDVIKPLDAETWRLEILVGDQAPVAREISSLALDDDYWRSGREVFSVVRALVTSAKDGADDER